MSDSSRDDDPSLPAASRPSASPIEAPQPILWTMDVRTLRPTFVSKESEQLLGFPAEEWTKPGFWQERLLPEDLVRTAEFMRAAADGGPVQEIDYRILTKDGRRIWLRTLVRLLPRPGQDAELVGVTFDQSFRRRADALIAGDLKILELVASGMPLLEILRELALVIEEQADGMIASVLLLENGRIVRHAAGPHLPPAFAKAVDGEEIGPDRGSCGTAAHRGEAVIVEDIATDPLWARYRDGALAAGLRACWSVPIKAQDRSVLGTFALYYSKPRRPSSELLELARHASHLAAVAIERDRRSEALRASEEHLRLISEHVDDVLFHLQVEPGGDYKFLSINAAFTRSTGLAVEQILGKSVKEIIPEPSLALVLTKYAEAIRTKKTVRWEEATPYPTGVRYGDVAITPVFDAADRPKFLVGSVRDFTARKKLEEEVRQLQKLEAIGRLTGGVAHDFNNLLTVILGYGELLLGQFPKDKGPHGDIQEMVNAGRRAAALTRQLLAFARKQTLQPQRLDLNAVVSGLEKMLRRLIREDIQFRMTLAPDLRAVLADPGQLEQVIVNLAVNSRDAITGPGHISFETSNAELDASFARGHSEVRPGSYVMLAISDSGSGMSAETKARIFEPFFTTKEQGKGTGLGLATVYGIVKQSGGHIWVYSEPGRGTTFKVYLPRASGGSGLVKAAVESTAPPTGGEEILVVEDESAVRALCEKLLKGLNYKVTVAENGEAALAALERRGLKPDLLITDLIMPGMNGRELASRIRQHRSGLKVLYMSGYTDKTVDDQGILNPGTLFLQKPFTLSALAKMVRQALENTPQ